MDFIADLPVIGGPLISIIGFVIVLGVVVFVHEYGHYIAARWCGIHAEVFSMGFGPVLTSWKDRQGTTWQIAALPLGGYVKFIGDADASSRASSAAMDGLSDEDRHRSFPAAAIWRRAVTVAAGPVANFILSIVVFGGIAMWQGVPIGQPVVGQIYQVPADVGENGLHSGDRLIAMDGTPIETIGDVFEKADQITPGPVAFLVERNGQERTVTAPYPLPPLVSSVEPLSAAAAAGLRSGDYIRAIDGAPISGFSELRQAVLASGGEPLAFDVIRDGASLPLEITPRVTERLDLDGNVETRVMIGVGGQPLFFGAVRTPMPWEAAWIGANRVVEIISLSLTGIGHIITGALGADNLQGPIGIAQISGSSASQGALDLILLIGVISTAIGMLNLFPIPVLDGGHLMMFAYEAIAGRPPADRVLKVAMTIGLSLVLLLMVFATYNDIMRLVVS